VQEWRNLYVDLRLGSADYFANELFQRNIGLAEFGQEVGDQLTASLRDLYVFGRGGSRAMEPADWDALNALVKTQGDYFRGFLDEVAAGGLTEAQIRARSRMYINSSIQSYERANARARGLPDLPQYPGDGNTRCLTNCQCHLSYEWADGAWLVYWNLGVAEHCPDCEAMAAAWSPYEILSAVDTSVRDWSKEYADRDVEYLGYIDQDTGELLGSNRGDIYQCWPSDEMTRRAAGRNLISIHSHPRSTGWTGTFSIQDMVWAVQEDERAMYVVGDKLYIMEIRPGFPIAAANIDYEAWVEQNNQLRAIAKEVRQGKISNKPDEHGWSEADYVAYSRAWKAIAEKYSKWLTYRELPLL